ncbi:MAG: TetR/AcrR family transcriptional regulator [Acidimicrobiales bacterium]|nr:TetR/AcrR family transcriptional regulator [Acidimicrobiales bacterium]
MADAATAAPAPVQGQRERILDIALGLMAERGASGTSMRALADACGLNVAALYHYFPSKDALLRAVIEERRYGAQLQSLPIPDLRLPPEERVAALVVEMWDGAMAEAPIWRLLLSEALHGDDTARDVGDDLRRTLEGGLAEALPRLVPELAIDLDVATRLVAATLLALLVESSLVSADEVAARARTRARDVARVLVAGA